MWGDAHPIHTFSDLPARAGFARPARVALTTCARRRAKPAPIPLPDRIIGNRGARARPQGSRQREGCMRIQAKIAIAVVAGAFGLASAPAVAQGVGKYLAPRDQVVAIRAGNMFDARSGALLGNQVIVIRGDRIADVGPTAEIPAGASVIDLSNATVLPGMIDVHVHVNTGGDNMSR